MQIHFLGLVRYSDALTLMEDLHRKIVLDPDHPGAVLVVQHPNVVTMGNRLLEKDMLFTAEQLERAGVDFAKIDRGGSVTVHEPGQIVIYPLLRLHPQKLPVKKFVWCLEEAMIRLCAEYGVTAARDEINPGVWCGSKKIGALGIRVQDKVSKHGLALNVTNDLTTFSRIVPCGILGRGVTSLSRESEQFTSGTAKDFSTAETRLARHVCELLSSVTLS